MSQYDELLTKALSVRNNTSPASNTATLVGGVLVSIVSALSSIEEEIKEAGGGGITPEQFSQMLASQITSYLEPYVKKAGDEITGSLLVDQELIANILKLRDSEGNVVTITYDEGKLNIDKTIMSSEDIIAFGVQSTQATTILDLINETITANPLYPATADLDKIKIGNVIYNIGGGDVNWGGITGTGNAVTDITYDVTTKQLSAVKDATFLTQHQDISGKADKSTTLSGYGITNAYTKSETDSQITNKINGLDVADASVANQFVTAVSETDGKISVSRASLTATNIAQAGKLSNAISGNADTATKLASITDGSADADMKILVIGSDGKIYTSPNVTSNYAQGSIKGKKVQITDGTNTATMTINENGIYVDKPIICQGDVVAYGVPSTSVDSVQQLIVNYINEHKSEFGSIDNVVIATATGSGNVITGLSASLSADKRTITLTPNNGITALTQHQDISGKSNTTHTHSVKINGATKTIAASGGTAVDLGTYLTEHQDISGKLDKSAWNVGRTTSQQTDWNSLTTNGNYFVMNDAVTNKPSGVDWYGQLLVLRGDKTDTITQLYFPYNGGNPVVRSGNPLKSGGSWNAWKSLAYKTDITSAIGALDVTDTAVDNKFVTAVSEVDGKISVSRATLTATNIAQAGKLSNATSGNAATATTLATARTLWGNSFNGSANINGDILHNASSWMMARNFTDKWSDGIDSHPWYGYHYNHGNGVYSTTISDYFGMTLKTANGRISINQGGQVGIGTDPNSAQALRVNGVIRGVGQAMFDGLDLNGNGITRLSDFRFNGATTTYSFLKSGATDRTQVADMGYSSSNGQYMSLGTSSLTGNSRLNVVNSKGENRLLIGTNGNAYLANGFEDDTTWSSNKVYLLNSNSGYTMLASTAARNGATADRSIYIRPSGLTSSTNQTLFQSTGVTISGSSASTLVIKRTTTGGGALISLYANNQSTNYWRTGYDTGGTYIFQYNGSTKAYFSQSGDLVANGDVTAYSDARLKKNITDLDDRGFLRPVEYDKDGRHSIGFVAQEVRDLYPEVVIGTESDNSFLSVNYGAITAILQKQIINQQKQIDELRMLFNKLMEE